MWKCFQPISHVRVCLHTILYHTFIEQIFLNLRVIFLEVWLLVLKHRLKVKIQSLYPCFIPIEKIIEEKRPQHCCTYHHVCTASCAHLSYFFAAYQQILMLQVYCRVHNGEVYQMAGGTPQDISHRTFTLRAIFESMYARHFYYFSKGWLTSLIFREEVQDFLW